VTVTAADAQAGFRIVPSGERAVVDLVPGDWIRDAGYRGARWVQVMRVDWPVYHDQCAVEVTGHHWLIFGLGRQVGVGRAVVG
jgi:hypothetical protein